MVVGDIYDDIKVFRVFEVFKVLKAIFKTSRRSRSAWASALEVPS